MVKDVTYAFSQEQHHELALMMKGFVHLQDEKLLGEAKSSHESVSERIDMQNLRNRAKAEATIIQSLISNTVDATKRGALSDLLGKLLDAQSSGKINPEYIQQLCEAAEQAINEGGAAGESKETPEQKFNKAFNRMDELHHKAHDQFEKLSSACYLEGEKEHLAELEEQYKNEKDKAKKIEIDKLIQAEHQKIVERNEHNPNLSADDRKILDDWKKDAPEQIAKSKELNDLMHGNNNIQKMLEESNRDQASIKINPESLKQTDTLNSKEDDLLGLKPLNSDKIQIAASSKELKGADKSNVMAFSAAEANESDLLSLKPLPTTVKSPIKSSAIALS